MFNLNEFFVTETKHVRNQYEVCLERFNDAKGHLDTLFKEKIVLIKEKCAKFFCKMEVRVEEVYKQITDMSAMFKSWQDYQQGPTQKYDAQIHTLRNIVSCADRERETEFALLKTAVKQLVVALEDKNAAQVNDPESPGGQSYFAMRMAQKKNEI